MTIRVRTLQLYAVALIIVLFVGGVASNWQSIGLTIGPSCAVGVSGTAAVVTARGWDAPTACRSMAGASTSIYSYSGPSPALPIVCQYMIDGVRVTVQDEGLLKIEGTSLCTYFQRGSIQAK